MKKRNHNRFFSLIFVPDQEKDPKSISLSYTQGRIIFIVLVFLSLHFIFGGIGYFRI